MSADSFSLDDFEAFARRLADAARAETLPRFRAGAAIVAKAGAQFDPVTDADREAERVLRGIINAHYPAHGVIGEEFGAERAEADYCWVLDPVDGTRAFICGISTWATLIGFEHRRAPALGVIDQPFTDERWIGRAGKTVYARGGGERPCRTSGVTDLKDARLSTTDPRREAYFSEDEAAAFAAIAGEAKVARFSLDAYAYGLLALGELDLVVESNLKHHDYCALVAVVEGAGGVISGWKGEALGACARGRIVAAASPALHEAAIRRLEQV